MDLHANNQATDHNCLDLEWSDKDNSSPEFWEGILFPDQNPDYYLPIKQKRKKRINYKAYIQKGSISFSMKEDFPLDVSKEFVISYFNKQIREFGGRIQKIVRMKCKKTI